MCDPTPQEISYFRRVRPMNAVSRVYRHEKGVIFGRRRLWRVLYGSPVTSQSISAKRNCISPQIQLHDFGDTKLLVTVCVCVCGETAICPSSINCLECVTLSQLSIGTIRRGS
jgi:hypothetical protein